MRIILTISALLMVFSAEMSGQSDFATLDRKTYEYYLNGDYRNLKKTADTLFSQKTDYYFLRMRLGILSFNKQLYYRALTHFTKALEFNSTDTVSREYIYKSYLYSGRKADAGLYLGSLPPDKQNNSLLLTGLKGSTEFYLGSSVVGYNSTNFTSNNLYYESLRNTITINAGLETYLTSSLKASMAFTNLRKSGTLYSTSVPLGADIGMTQNQVYARLTGIFFPGWELSGFGHIAFYSDRSTSNRTFSEYLGGVGISKNGWKVRTGASLSISNFNYSRQIRGECYLTLLPFSNINLYLTSGWMGQTDKNWGETYQVSQEIGLKVFKFLWLESGIISGNSFLYARNQGYTMNNSFQIPATTIYGNFIITPWKRFSITISPFYLENHNYSWDLTTFARTNKLTHTALGGTIKLIYKNR